MPFFLAFSSNWIRYSSRLESTFAFMLDAKFRSSSHPFTVWAALSRLFLTNHKAWSCQLTLASFLLNNSASLACDIINCYLKFRQYASLLKAGCFYLSNLPNALNTIDRFR